MEKIYQWLFGESKWQQKKKLKKLFILTAILAVIAFILLLDGPGRAAFMAVVIILMWGWSFVRAAAVTVCRVLGAFGSDVAIFVLTLILWVFLGIIGGVIALILGIIRLIQIWDE